MIQSFTQILKSAKTKLKYEITVAMLQLEQLQGYCPKAVRRPTCGVLRSVLRKYHIALYHNRIIININTHI